MTNAAPDRRQSAEDPKWYFRLVGFYLSCAGVALGATVAAAGFLWFESVAALVVGATATALCAFTCFSNLSAIRR